MPKKPNRPKRTLRPVLHIFCEGEKTEPNYIHGYLDKFHPGHRRLRVIVIEKTDKNTPVQLIEEAIAKKKSAPEGDYFWVVYDRENEKKYPAKLHVNARVKANKHGVGIALSNVCFEVWILLHYQTGVAAYHSCDDLIAKSDLRKKHIPSYEKTQQNLFDVLADKVENARQNAERLNKSTRDAAEPKWTRPDQLNPYTDVHKLL
ncbi:MAG: RloB family protein, partial [Myxococcota bacterium]|nr:RloB family protein [Myxococcota bacterium]